MEENIYKTIHYKIKTADFKWQDAIEDIQKAFKQNPNGMNWTTFICGCIDRVLRHTWNRYVPDYNVQNLCIMAVGGYGRGGCAPYSDVDIVFLYEDTQKNIRQNTQGIYQFDGFVQNMVRALWDMGFKVGQRIHAIPHLIQQIQTDTVLETAVLTHRYIVGDYGVYKKFVETLPQNHTVYKITDFIHKKQAEQSKRHEKFGVSQYILEPNIKQSKGAIRDLDMVYWICLYTFPKIKSIYDLAVYEGVEKPYLDDFMLCMRFFDRVRTCMHLISGKASDILYFDMQKQVAKMLGYQDIGDVRGVEIFMGDYYRHVSKSEITVKALLGCINFYLHPDVHTALPASVIDTFPTLHTGVNIHANMVCVQDVQLFAHTPDMLVIIFEVAQKYGYDIHPTTLVSIQQFLDTTPVYISTSPTANKALLKILQGTRAHVMLHYMNISGVLSCVLPEWKTIYCQMQYDMYHDYTTDAHTIRAIKEWGDIHRQLYVSELPIISHLAQDIRQSQQRHVILVVAILLHDIAKGCGGDHAILGAKIACTVCTRMGMSALAIDTVQWLVRHHLLLSHTADRRDIMDLKTLRDFTKLVHSVYVLDLLAVLTIVDVRSVGKVWTPWKHSLIMKVYDRAKRHLGGNMVSVSRKNMLPIIAKRLSHVDNIYPILSRLTTEYLEATPDDVIDWHVTKIAKCDGGCMHIRQDTQNRHTQIMVYTTDMIGITARITAILTRMQINIMGADIFTFYKLGVLHTYRVQSVNGYMEQEVCHKMATILSNPYTPPPRKIILGYRNTAFQVQSQVIIDNQISYNATMIEVHTRNRYGVLAVITQVLSDLAINIRSARITSYGEWVCDVFYVQDKYGFKIYREQAKKSMRESLYTALQNLDKQ